MIRTAPPGRHRTTRPRASARTGLALAVASVLLCACAADGDPALDCTAPTAFGGPPPRTFSPAFDALGDAPANDVDTGLADALATVLQRGVARTDATRATAALVHPTLGRWRARIGGDGAAGEDPGTPFWWASVGKLATSAILHGLAAEGRLSLDDTLDRWYPDYPQAPRITLRSLLDHTAGAFSFQRDLELRERGGYVPPEALIAVSASHGADFCPGTAWSYSNTGYVLLARVAERITGRTLATLVAERVSGPLGLATLRVLERGAPPGAVVAPAGIAVADVGAIATVHGAGAVVADAPDALALLIAWLDGTLVPSAARDGALARTHPMYGTTMHYGLGLMATEVPDPARPALWIGHSGGSPEAKGLVLFDVPSGAAIAIALNAQAPAEAIAGELLKALDRHD